MFVSTHSENMDPNLYTCASDPRIDNYVRFVGSKVEHDGFKQSRQDKVHEICEFIKKREPFPIRVCYSSDDGKNCCQCEKCLRTASAFFAERTDPKVIGLGYDIGMISRQFNSAVCEIANSPARVLYRDIHKTLRKNYIVEELPKELKAFYILEFDEYMSIASGANVWREKYYKLKVWTDQLQDSKNWLEQQYYELKAWTDQLQDSKDWLEKENNELKNWTCELQTAKEWLEEQYIHLKETIK